VTFEEIERLVRLVAETDLGEVEVHRGGVHLRIARPSSRQDTAHHAAMHAAASWPGPAPAASAAGPASAAAPAAPAAPVDEDEGLHVIRATMVGTFYRRPNPEAQPYVKEGDVVRKGQVICILEAMKLLNEIECDVSGTIARVYAEDAQPVEYGEKLMAVRPG
jgi:acetyl-CoA carboxylase biotin carboxyl carrier protein